MLDWWVCDLPLVLQLILTSHFMFLAEDVDIRELVVCLHPYQIRVLPWTKPSGSMVDLILVWPDVANFGRSVLDVPRSVLRSPQLVQLAMAGQLQSTQSRQVELNRSIGQVPLFRRRSYLNKTWRNIKTPSTCLLFQFGVLYRVWAESWLGNSIWFLLLAEADYLITFRRNASHIQWLLDALNITEPALLNHCVRTANQWFMELNVWLDCNSLLPTQVWIGYRGLILTIFLLEDHLIAVKTVE